AARAPPEDAGAAVGAGTRAEAARQAQRVVSAAGDLGRDGALAVALGVGAGVGVSIELADAARHLVAMVLRADADADVPARRRHAGHLAAPAAAALLVARAEAVQDLAAEPGLTDVDAGQRPGPAVLAAATSAAVAEDAVVLAAAGPGGGDVGADPLRGARGLRTDAAAAVEIARADVTRLNAERRAERAGAVLAKAGATAAGAAIGRAGARVAGGQAGRVERLALAVRARAAATGRRAGASGAVGGAAGRARADPAGTLKIAAVGVHPARAPGAAAGRDPRCAGPGGRIAQLGAAIGVGRAGDAKRCALDRGAARARLTTLTAGRAPLAAARARLT